MMTGPMPITTKNTAKSCSAAASTSRHSTQQNSAAPAPPCSISCGTPRTGKTPATHQLRSLLRSGGSRNSLEDHHRERPVRVLLVLPEHGNLARDQPVETVALAALRDD